MTTLKISLSESASNWLEQRVKAGDFQEVGEYIESLIGQDQASFERLRVEVEKGLKSGVSTQTRGEILESAKRELRAEKERTDEILLMAALKMFELGRLSVGKATELAGMTQADFLHAYGEASQVTNEDRAAIREYDEAARESEEAIPIEQAFEDLKRESS